MNQAVVVLFGFEESEASFNIWRVGECIYAYLTNAFSLSLVGPE